jgi:hypothetical protein
MYDHQEGKPKAKLNEHSDITISSGGISTLVLYLSARRPAHGDRKIEGNSMHRNSSDTPDAPAASLSLRTTAKVVRALPRNEAPDATESNWIFRH